MYSLSIVFTVCLFGVVASVVYGIGHFVFNRQNGLKSQKAMQWRVIFQVCAILLLYFIAVCK